MRTMSWFNIILPNLSETHEVNQSIITLKSSNPQFLSSYCQEILLCEITCSDSVMICYIWKSCPASIPNNNLLFAICISPNHGTLYIGTIAAEDGQMCHSLKGLDALPLCFAIKVSSVPREKLVWDRIWSYTTFPLGAFTIFCALCRIRVFFLRS